MSLEGISSKGSLRFDEFPTSMKATQSFSGSRATRLLASKTQDRQSLVARPVEGASSLGLRRLRFPFFKSQCQRAGGRGTSCPTPEPPMETNPPSGVNDSRSVSRRPEQTPLLSERIARSRIVSQVMRATPRVLADVRFGFTLVKGSRTKPVKSFFLGFVIIRPHSCPIASTLLPG
jgi:hypothetical protein